MCEYCDKKMSYGTKELDEYDGTTVFIAKGSIIISDHPSITSRSIDINYCPMCGDKL